MNNNRLVLIKTGQVLSLPKCFFIQPETLMILSSEFTLLKTPLNFSTESIPSMNSPCKTENICLLKKINIRKLM